MTVNGGDWKLQLAESILSKSQVFENDIAYKDVYFKVFKTLLCIAMVFFITHIYILKTAKSTLPFWYTFKLKQTDLMKFNEFFF